MKEKLLGIAQVVLTALVILAGAIALPVLFRPFFYWHIAPFDLCDRVGLTPEQVKTAYNEMMNFCIGISDTFSAGVLPFSESGADHFADVRKLFLLDLVVLLGAVLLLPEEFFRNCALLILSVVLLSCAVLVLSDIRKRKKETCQ